ncbi:MAG: hypothetical protein ACREM1_10540 [Longimicrobiales bacterium]
MIMDSLSNPTVKAAIDVLQNRNREAWSELFESDAKLYDDGEPRSLEAFTRDAVGHERFTSIDRVDNNGLDLVGDSIRINGEISERTSVSSCRLRARSPAYISGRPHRPPIRE